MNSTISDDLNREHLALETAKCLKNIFANTQNLNILHKELLEINLSLRAYIEESKSRLNVLRLELAHEAKSSHEVVAILSEKYLTFVLPATFVLWWMSSLRILPATETLSITCEIAPQLEAAFGLVEKMSNLSTTPQNVTYNSNKRRKITKRFNNPIEQISKHDSTKNFITWYKHMIDYERQNLCMYVSDNVTLEWFGRTIRTRKKVSAFFNYDMECTRHDFRSIERIEKIQSREERDKSINSSVLATPLDPEIKSTSKRKLRSDSFSPEKAESPETIDIEFISCKKKRLKRSHIEATAYDKDVLNKVTNLTVCNDKNDINDKGDGAVGHKQKRTSITPTNVECGQGDCLPSTSGTDSDRSHDTLNAQLPKLAVECNGYIEFTRSRNNHCVDTVKWNRKCKVQISYSEDCLNPGEYIIWAMCYNDGSKCRRNLLAAFEEAAKEDEN